MERSNAAAVMGRDNIELFTPIEAIIAPPRFSSMTGTFSKEKLKAYIEETRQYRLPLLRKAKNLYPEALDTLFVLKYHCTSMLESIETTIRVYETSETQGK